MNSSQLEQSLEILPIRNLTSQKRILELARGLEDVKEFVRGIEQINAYILFPGRTGGNHIHPELKDEIIYPLFGDLLLALEHPETRARYQTKISPGYKFKIRKGIAHAITNQTENVVVFLDTSTLEFSPGRDLVAYQVYNLSQ